MKKNSMSLLVILLVIITGCFKVSSTFAQNGDKQIFLNYLQYMQPFLLASEEMKLQKTAEFFIDKPYVANTLDVKEEKEKLVVNLREFDCVTFVETVMALTQTIRENNPSFEDFETNLSHIRYRQNAIDGYTSRLHYTTDWYHDNAKKGVLKMITKPEFGKLEAKRIDFMSSHRDSYKALRRNDDNLNKIKQIEDDINKRGGFYILPKQLISSYAPQIPHMAIIGFATSIAGLDTTHMGFAYKSSDGLRFIHASSVKGKIVIDTKSLHDYCKSQSNCTGIILAEML